MLPLKPYPPLATPQHILRAAQDAAAHPLSAPARGLLSLREAICRRLAEECGASIDPGREVLITNGAMNALHVVFLGLLEPGDEVIVPAPCFFLEGLVERLGARLVFVSMQEERDFAWDLERIQRAISGRTKLLFLNTPVNPTGYILTQQEIEQLAHMAVVHGICILSDESYDRLAYDGRRHISPLTLADWRKHTVLVRSFTKSYVMPSWRVGYIVAEAGLTALFLKMFEWINLNANYVCQAAASAAMSGPQQWLSGASCMLQASRDRVLAGIQRLPLKCVKPQGGPFIFPNVSQLGVQGDEFADLLLQKLGVSAVAGAAFQSPPHVRIPIGASSEIIDELVSRLQQAVEAVKIQH
jgi:aspartate aminotransferase/aminotransferase